MPDLIGCHDLDHLLSTHPQSRLLLKAHGAGQVTHRMPGAVHVQDRMCKGTKMARKAAKPTQCVKLWKLSFIRWQNPGHHAMAGAQQGIVCLRILSANAGLQERSIVRKWFRFS